MSDPISQQSAVDTSSILAPTVSTDTSRLKSRKNLEAAGQQFEAIFTGMMLKSMRAPHLAEDIFGSKGQDTFRDLQDQQLAKSMAAHAPMGIGKAMVDFLAKSQNDLAASASQADLNQDSPQASP
ncbi:hypothetical protein BH09PSE4_BH09PSE4_00530 [soil metagenome]